MCPFDTGAIWHFFFSRASPGAASGQASIRLGTARSCWIRVVKVGEAQVLEPGPVRSRSVRYMAHRAGDGRVGGVIQLSV